MTDYEFQLQNEISELRSIINSLRAKLKESLQREDIAKKVIADQRKEIYELKTKCNGN